LTVEDIAKELNVSHVVVLNWIRRDEMRSKKIGKNWRTARLWLSEFIETPDAGPHLEGDANLELRRARLQLVRENYKRKRATKQQQEARARAQDESGPAVKRKRGRPRKKPISETAET
jgi:excisionase family DNA binding protein